MQALLTWKSIQIGTPASLITLIPSSDYMILTVWALHKHKWNSQCHQIPTSSCFWELIPPASPFPNLQQTYIWGQKKTIFHIVTDPKIIKEISIHDMNNRIFFLFYCQLCQILLPNFFNRSPKINLLYKTESPIHQSTGVNFFSSQVMLPEVLSPTL